MKKKPYATRRDKIIGLRIRAARKLVGQTQQELGDAIGVRPQTIQKYERGQARVSAVRLEDIATELDQPILYFYGYTMLESQNDNETPAFYCWLASELIA